MVAHAQTQDGDAEQANMPPKVQAMFNTTGERPFVYEEGSGEVTLEVRW